LGGEPEVEPEEDELELELSDSVESVFSNGAGEREGDGGRGTFHFWGVCNGVTGEFSAESEIAAGMQDNSKAGEGAPSDCAFE
jgi:hypothetical protein